eukprot:g5846.t1
MENLLEARLGLGGGSPTSPPQGRRGYEYEEDNEDEEASSHMTTTEDEGAASAHAPTTTVLTTEDEVRSVLLAVYEQWNADKLGDVDRILEAFAGNETRMFEQLWGK